jgi:hypothetical protein
MKPLPQVSVLMPVRDGERWMSASIDSVLRQTLTDFELIIVNDGSVDRTPAILESYALRDQRIRVIHTDRKGVAVALNHGLAQARAALTARLDADDLCVPYRLEKQVQFLSCWPDVALLGSWAEMIDENGKILRQIKPKTRHHDLVALLERRNPFVHSSIMMRTAVARALGGYRTAFEAAEDYDLWLRICKTNQVANLAEFLIQYRQHTVNVSKIKMVRQAFSVRLAQRCQPGHPGSAPEAQSQLDAPPDFLSPQANDTFYAEDAAIYRFLALAEPETAGRVDINSIDLQQIRRRTPQLSHDERKLAALAVVNLLHSITRLPFSRVSLVVLLFQLHPARALRIAFRLFSGACARYRA